MKRGRRSTDSGPCRLGWPELSPYLIHHPEIDPDEAATYVFLLDDVWMRCHPKPQPKVPQL